jgi:hypothetical protein
MRSLNWNHRKVQNLTPWEIRGFIAGRVLTSFGLGVLAMEYFPYIAARWAVPTLIMGIAFLIFAARGLARKQPTTG